MSKKIRNLHGFVVGDRIIRKDKNSSHNHPILIISAFHRHKDRLRSPSIDTVDLKSERDGKVYSHNAVILKSYKLYL